MGGAEGEVAAGGEGAGGGGPEGGVQDGVADEDGDVAGEGSGGEMDKRKTGERKGVDQIGWAEAVQLDAGGLGTAHRCGPGVECQSRNAVKMPLGIY